MGKTDENPLEFGMPYLQTNPSLFGLKWVCQDMGYLPQVSSILIWKLMINHWILEFALLVDICIQPKWFKKMYVTREVSGQNLYNIHIILIYLGVEQVEKFVKWSPAPVLKSTIQICGSGVFSSIDPEMVEFL